MSLISVIVPIYGVEKYLDRCVRSIVSQTYNELEIILVDDGSPDDCPRICDEWAKKDNRITVIHKENGGLSDARNAGFAKAHGKLIGFVDSDDWLEPEFYEVLLHVMTENGADVSGCAFRRISGEEPAPEKKTAVHIYEKEDALRANIEKRIKQVVWNKLYKREIIEDIPFEKGKYHEDEFWSYQVFARTGKYAESDFVGYNYFIRSGSIIEDVYSVKRLDAVEAKCLRQGFLEEKYPEISSCGRIDLYRTCMHNGQNIVRYLRGEEKRTALKRVKSAMKQFPLTDEDMSRMKPAHRFWARLSRLSLTATCSLRNFLNIGF